GTVLALAEAEPAGDKAACAEAIARLDVASCQLRYGEFCDTEFLEEQLADTSLITPRCPTHVVVGELEPDGQRVALLPIHDPVNLACFEMIDRFKPKG
ncbi:MAG: hypothetical protein AAF721_38700, partial [Myxococcota bacterium]